MSSAFLVLWRRQLPNPRYPRLFGRTLFDEGGEVKQGMIGFVHALDQENGQIAVDFNAALGGGREKGDIVSLVSLDAIDLV